MNEHADHNRDSAEYSRSDRIDSICDAFEGAWRGEQRPAIDEFLADAVAVDAEGALLRPVLLRELLLVELHFRAEAGETPTQQDYLDRFAADTEVVREAFAGHESTKTDRPGRPSAVTFKEGTRFGDYVLQEEIARGGMGIVYKARQTGLNRTVALKMILSGALSNDEDILRFRSEAEAAAKLDHPNIVPIYDVGVQDGQHYFSMGYVAGNSLKEAIVDGPLSPRQAAKLMQIIATAVHHAHTQGIVHRDLKPANVLLDESGQPKVTDFGLAKRIDQDSDMTVAGQVMGTPSYMPPEQAAGRIGEIDRRSDVYSLGATLYCLLTGRPPFQSASIPETLRQVAEREPVPLRQLNAEVSRDLETICLQCLEKRPDGRYQSAADLAAELGRFLEGRPILARPVSRPARLWRWTKRNPVLATVSGVSLVLLLTLAIGGPLVAFDQARLRNIADFEKDRADAEAETAATERDNARQEVKEQLRTLGAYVDTVGEAELLKDPRFTPLKQKLLKDALANYQRFLEQYRNDPEWEPTVADALYRIAFMTAITVGSSIEDALTAYQKALTVYERLARQNPTGTRYQSSLARCHNSIGLLYKQTGRPDDALVSYRKALSIWERLGRENPTVAGYQNDIAIGHNNIGVLYQHASSLTDALVEMQKAVEIRERLVHRNPTDTRYRSELAANYNNIGLFYEHIGKSAEALATHLKALEVEERLAQENPIVTKYQWRLARSHNNIGLLYRHIGKPVAALAAHQKALEIQERLARENPTETRYQFNLSGSYNNIGGLYRETGKLAEALAAYQKGMHVQERLVRENPTVDQYESSLAQSLNNIGWIYFHSGMDAKALVAYRRALEIRERLAGENPTVNVYQSDLAQSYNGIGLVYSQSGKMAEALAAHQRALDIRQGLFRENATVTIYAIDLSGSLVNLANLKGTEDSKTAFVVFSRAILILGDVLQRESRNINARQFLKNAHANRAMLYGRMKNHQDAADDWKTAIELSDGRWYFGLRSHILSLARAGQHQDALARADQLAAQVEEVGNIYDLACVHSLCASAASKDKAIDGPSRKLFVDAHSKKSLTLLKQAAENDAFQEKQDRDLLIDDEDLAALRDREDFQEFLKSLDK